MNEVGFDRIARWCRRVARSLEDPPEPDAWADSVSPRKDPPEDGSPRDAWRRLLELAEVYPDDPGEEPLWRMAEVLFDLCRWYLGRPVTEVSGIGPARAETLERLDVRTLRDLVLHLPRTYSDRRFFTPIRELTPDGESTVRGRILEVTVRRGRRPRLVVRLGDDTGVLRVNFWNQLYLGDQLERDDTLMCTGRVEEYRNRPQMNNPDFERVEEGGETGGIQAVYPGTEGLSQKRLRRWIRRALEGTRPLWLDCLPAAVRRNQGLPGRRAMLETLHEPESPQQLETARRRLVFEEFFWYQLVFLGHRWRVRRRETGRAYPSRTRTERFLEDLPFALTADQLAALEEIEEGLAESAPMNRLLQGDVGTGKTVVAAASILRVVENGYQAVFMAPTEILAEQHFHTLYEHFRDRPVAVELLVGGLSAEERRSRREALARGEVDVVVGTHALLTEEVEFRELGYVVIDEQHRFGVEQRRTLRRKGPDTDLLIVSATPIPRSLARGLYADLSVTTLRTYPVGPRDVHTELLEDTRAHREDVYDRLDGLPEGGRAFLVFPAVRDGEEGIEGALDAFRRARESGRFEPRGIGVLHGGMDREETRRTVDAFRSGEIQVLFCTTVVEIGIDVPEASHLVVHDAERFGLAQLHQLRGRIGRSGQEAWMFLMADPDVSEEARERLQVLTRTDDGLAVARADLEHRGMGDPAGRRQAGEDPFRRGDPWRDRAIMKAARQEAAEQLQATAGLTTPDARLMRRKLVHDYGERRLYAGVD